MLLVMRYAESTAHLLHNRFEANTVLYSFNTIQPSSFLLLSLDAHVCYDLRSDEFTDISKMLSMIPYNAIPWRILE